MFATMVLLPMHYEPVYDYGAPMELAHQCQQINLLTETIQSWLTDKDGLSAVGVMFMHFSLDRIHNQDFRASDFFPVLGFSLRGCNDWAQSAQGEGPAVIIDLLAGNQANWANNGKNEIHRGRTQVPEYFWFNPSNPDDWGGYQLSEGNYEPLSINSQGCLISSLLGLALVRWQGVFQDVDATWLRWAELDGLLLPTERERAAKMLDEAERRAKFAEQRIERAEQIAEAHMRRAEKAAQRADAEAKRAIAAEAEVTLLRALLAEQDGAD